MTRRAKRFAMAGVGGVLMLFASLAIVSTVAAAATTGTNTSVTATPSSTTTGRPVTIKASVTAVTTNAAVFTGTVTFSITGSDSSTVNCSGGDAVTISHSGKATCTVGYEELQAAASPYAISATYSGDTNYGGSTGSTSETVTPAKTKSHMKVSPKVRSGTANVFTLTVKAKPKKAGSLLAGDVRFTVSGTNTRKSVCAGGDLQPLAVSGNVGTAKCSLPSGWFRVPAPTKTEKHPSARYGVGGVYLGNGNFLSSQRVKRGVVH